MSWQEISTGLAAPFPPGAIHWRAQTVTKDGTKAMALAYLDARDVMDRLDAVAGPENWQDSYHETAKGRLICTLSIRCDGEWIAKSDGAGETDVEGEKGAISAALKRAAVKWGIGRYLYDMPTPWVPCETGPNGKWRKWKADPWSFVRGASAPPAQPAPDGPTPASVEGESLMLIDGAQTYVSLTTTVLQSVTKMHRDLGIQFSPQIKARYAERKAALARTDPQAPPQESAA